MKRPPALKDLVAFFPQVDLPITLTSEIHHIFSKENKPLPEVLIRGFLREDENEDEFTEYVACFRLPAMELYQSLVFWKASLMSYEYILATYQPDGLMISSKVIAGTKSNGNSLLKRIATIDEEGLILIAEGEGPLDERRYNADQSHTYQLEITETGDILQMIIEN
ncbi:MAG: hypothetical protein HKN76_05875 [Saprospiraceae bacterium]|nr:hypothetical protein [Saprospiraceae bacterium]